jgi:hypothetical protein
MFTHYFLWKDQVVTFSRPVFSSISPVIVLKAGTEKFLEKKFNSVWASGSDVLLAAGDGTQFSHKSKSGLTFFAHFIKGMVYKWQKVVQRIQKEAETNDPGESKFGSLESVLSSSYPSLEIACSQSRMSYSQFLTVRCKTSGCLE